MTNEDIWYKNFEELQKYIEKNKMLPQKTNIKNRDNNIHKLRKWIDHQNENYSKKISIMKNNEIYENWSKFKEKYKNYFKTNIEIWKEILDKAKKYIDINKKKPVSNDKCTEIKSLGQWIVRQQKIYKTKIEIMKNKEIYDIWTKFTEEYNIYFQTNEEIWYDAFDKVKKYIGENKKIPPKGDKNEEIKYLGYWIGTQKNSYEKKDRIMRNEKIRKVWKNFTDEYAEYL